MAKQAEQLNLLPSKSSKGQIIPTALHTEMQRSYLEYAMSVIVGRALPDVRDGLKPVHRRILFAMHELGLVPERPYRKCARIVGDVLGKYHPHGDQSVYEALVRLVQDFSSRYPLLAGHGNFGSVDNDPPAAMRYTECRLAPIGNEALLSDIDEAVIDFTDNFDGSQLEPTVLPAQLPLLLLNGASGIAVGMATNIPPHNLNEIVDATIALIDRSDLPDEKLLELIPAPDFPTGGIILKDSGIKEAYTTGRGSITIRGVAKIEALDMGKGRKSRPAIIVTELPYQVNKAAWIEKVAELVTQGKLEGISDLRDESDRTGMRVVLELKKEANGEFIIEKLYRQTALQVNFGTIILALDRAQPKQMPLREVLQHFIQFREETLTRRYSYQLQKAQQRSHLVEGLVTVLAKLDPLIKLLRLAPDTATAKEQLQTKFRLSEAQAEAILAMPLRRITSLERQNLETERDELAKQIADLQVLLGDRRELLKSLKKDLRSLKKKHGDERRTQIMSLEQTAIAVSKSGESHNSEDETPSPTKSSGLATITEPPKPAVVQITHKGYAKRFDGDKAPTKQPTDDAIVAIYDTKTDDELIVLTAAGKAFAVEVGDIPAVSSKNAKSRGTPLLTLLPDKVDRIVSSFTWNKNPDPDASLVLLSSEAKIKRSLLSEFGGITARGLVAAKLKDEDKLLWAGIVKPEQQLAIATSGGRILRIAADEDQIPVMGRTAMGNTALRLRLTEQLVSPAILDLATAPETELLLVTVQGFAKRLKAKNLRLSPRGSIGSQAITFAAKDDSLIAIAAYEPNPPVSQLVTLLVGRFPEDVQVRSVQVPIADIPLENPNGQGKSIFDLAPSTDRSEIILRVSL